ncbi:DUF1523 family protein [Pseudorhodobacter sp. MZDSW-24AT]|uniref:DUF1523 family protein n=1 Tax=Pseudorhodobacter sp. MZDSW-24AT TaxID=2052957 RepID=UPI000C1E1413|nr:DUF1523 family protein [Pseudorhodobacter sp. MZDSW-24AT]PJF08645.1 DUF1523 domain-containing protein [Pseudorhodobacter sp. MZDSW-24AT]
MRYVKWGFWLMLATLVFGFLHYTLPQTDVVRIVGTENRRVDIGENSLFWSRSEVGMTNSTSRDVFFINAVYPNGRTMEYRNEDTGWGWPPYFKINSFGLQTQAKEFASTDAAPIWVALRHYGWRNQFFTIFPNAVSIKRVAGPDVTLIPWVNIVILTFLAFVLFMIRRVWLQFRERTIDPALEDASHTWDAVDARADAARDRAKGFFGGINAWLATWRRKPRK